MEVTINFLRVKGKKEKIQINAKEKKKGNREPSGNQKKVNVTIRLLGN